MNFFSGRAPSAVSDVAITLVDQTPAASHYFSSMRLPATFMATQAINTLFKLTNADATIDSAAKQVLIEMNQLLITLAFLTAIASVVSGTAAGVKILHGGFDPLALTPYDLLVREFEFEYLSVRWTFLASIFSFLVGMGTQSVVQFDLLQPHRRMKLLLFVSFLATVTTYLLSYINHNIYDYGSLGGMTFHFGKLIFARLEKKAEPLVLMFVGLASITAMLLSYVILYPMAEYIVSKFDSKTKNKFRNVLSDFDGKLKQRLGIRDVAP